MELRDDIREAKDRIKLRFGYRPELKTLESVLMPGETVRAMLFGKSGSLRGLIVLTTHRIVFHYHLPQAILSATNGASYPIAQITSIHTSARGLFAELAITVASSAIAFTEVPRQYADEFVNLTNQTIATAALR